MILVLEVNHNFKCLCLLDNISLCIYIGCIFSSLRSGQYTDQHEHAMNNKGVTCLWVNRCRGTFNTLPVLGQHVAFWVQMQCLYNRILSKLKNTDHLEIVCVTTKELILTDILNYEKLWYWYLYVTLWLPQQ